MLDTLLPIIHSGPIAYGTIIYSDQWADYQPVAAIQTVASNAVKHSIEMLTLMGVHTSNVVSYMSKICL